MVRRVSVIRRLADMDSECRTPAAHSGHCWHPIEDGLNAPFSYRGRWVSSCPPAQHQDDALRGQFPMDRGPSGHRGKPSGYWQRLLALGIRPWQDSFNRTEPPMNAPLVTDIVLTEARLEGLLL